MATWLGNYGDDYKSFAAEGYSHDTGFGFGGNDTILGSDGKDILYGMTGNDTLYGENHNDILYGQEGNDTLYGGQNIDTLYGGTGVDKLYGSTRISSDGAVDFFYFEVSDTGDLYANKADTIYDFEDADQIYLKGSYTYAGTTNTPGNGEYGIWQNGTDWVVTYNSSLTSGFHDIIVKGQNPLNDISFF